MSAEPTTQPDRIDTGTDRLIAQREDHIGWVIFNNPARHNALGRDMIDGMARALHALDADPSVRVIIMRGEGERAFVSGADIGQLGTPAMTAPDNAHNPSATSDDGGMRAISRVSKPTIAMIHGYCIGGGLMTAMSADLRISADDGQFGIPAGRLGVGYPHDGVRQLVGLVGPATAAEILFSAKRFDAPTALRMGLVNDVVAKAQLEATVRELAGAIAANAPLSLRAAKASIAAIVRGDHPDDVARAEALARDCWSSEDFAEGRQAFAEKRAPIWKGR